MIHPVNAKAIKTTCGYPRSYKLWSKQTLLIPRVTNGLDNKPNQV